MIIDINVNLSRWPFRRLRGDEISKWPELWTNRNRLTCLVY
jgi:hypothetical protein